MIYVIDVYARQFVLLSANPSSWQVLVPIAVGLIKGDVIRYREIDSLSIPTGLFIDGVIRWLSSGDMEVSSGSSTWAFCYDV